METTTTTNDQANHGPQLLLPSNLSALAKLASKERLHRYAANAVQLTRTAAAAGIGVQYTATVTDGRRLLAVDGYSDDPAEYPALPGLASAPNGAESALIDAKQWQAAFRAIPKGRHKPILGNVAVVMSEYVTTLATTDLDSSNVQQPRNVEGRYPAWEQLVCDLDKSAVMVDPRLLGELLLVAAEYTQNVRISVSPSMIRVESTNRSENGQRVRAVCVPLTPGSGKRPPHKPAPLEVALRSVARLSVVWSRHPKGYIADRCQRAMSALHAKYLRD